MEQKIADWYKEADIIVADIAQYDFRLECIKKFVNENYDIGLLVDLVDNFMNRPIVIESIQPLIDMINAKDKTVTPRSENELRLLSGMCLAKYGDEYQDTSIAIMMKLLYMRGYRPKIQEIYHICLGQLDNRRISYRQNITLEKSVKVAAKKLTEEQKTTWDESAADEIMNLVNNLVKCVRVQNDNIKELERILNIKMEETDILWWLVAKWSELFERKLSDISDLQAALIVPLELIEKVKLEIGPVAIFSVMKEALGDRENDKRYLLKEFINNVPNQILNVVNRYELREIERYCPVLLAIQKYEEYGDDYWQGIVKKECGIEIDKMEFSIEEMAIEVYYECELCKNID